MYTLNISRQLLTLCAKLQLENPKPLLSKWCPIALAANAKGMYEARAGKKFLTWLEHPYSRHRLRAIYSRAIVDWVGRFDRHHKYPNMLLQHVPPIVIKIVKLQKPTALGETHVIMTRSKLEMEFIRRTPRMCRKATSPSEFDKILKQNVHTDVTKRSYVYPKRA